MDKKEYQRQWYINNPDKVAKYRAKRTKKQRKCWHCTNNIPSNRRICDVCASTTLICVMCGTGVRILRSKRRYKKSYFCSKKCQYDFFKRTNIWRMYDELQQITTEIKTERLDKAIIKSQQQQIDELLEKNAELTKQVLIAPKSMGKYSIEGELEMNDIFNGGYAENG